MNLINEKYLDKRHIARYNKFKYSPIFNYVEKTIKYF